VFVILFGAVACTQAPTPAEPAKAAPPAGGSSAAPAAAPVTLKLAMYQPATHLFVAVFKKYMPLVERNTQGRVKVEIFDSETLAKGNEFIDAVQRGVADMALAFPPYNSATFPIFDEQYLPFGYRDVKGQMDSYENGLNELYIEEMKAKGLDKIATFGAVPTGGRYLITKKPVLVPDDMKGMKLRAAGSLERDLITKTGASGVATVASEVYEALERGIIDGAMAVHTNIVDWKWMEVTQHLLNLPVSYLAMEFIYNTDSWNKISATDKPIVETTIKLAISALSMEGTAVEIYRLSSMVPDRLTINTPTPEQRKQWLALSEPLIAGYKQKAGERGQKAWDIIQQYNKR
jgi:TRAP-type C4-dicarboxylate transport system substrate-binding protein